ncbi:MAG TPA: hypothetical protein PLJ21_02090 [Pseudobdellovibrionaceae bacterium]|nr:hypothetical protein [Pseudobdellovibrionaceae bacterium]
MRSILFSAILLLGLQSYSQSKCVEIFPSDQNELTFEIRFFI